MPITSVPTVANYTYSPTSLAPTNVPTSSSPTTSPTSVAPTTRPSTYSPATSAPSSTPTSSLPSANPTTSSPVTLAPTQPFTAVTSFSCTGTIVPWSVSITGNYTISVSGAQGGSASPGIGGNGANMTGTFFLTAGLIAIQYVALVSCFMLSFKL